jgi:endoglucanase
MPFRWERLQPTLNGPLNAVAVSDLQAAVGRANQAGLQVILDMHNFGTYATSGGVRNLGTAALPSADLANFWSRFASAFAGVAGVNSFDLMNEPHDLASVAVWQQASEQALLAVRATGSRTLIMVEGYDWAGTYNWSAVQPTPWITDPANNFRYEAHQYFDQDWSGRYADSYSSDLAAATAEGFKASC